jgi:hypothetical protein
MFPRCANLECSASFGSFREGTFFRFRRTDAAPEASAKHHSVEHAWLCPKCSERHTVEYRENRTILVPLEPAMPVVEVVEMIEAPGHHLPPRKRTRPNRRHRSNSRRAAAPSLANSPLVVLAITPRGDLDRN